MKTLEQLKEELKEFSTEQQLQALEDGEFLSKFDVTQEEVEELYHASRFAIYETTNGILMWEGWASDVDEAVKLLNEVLGHSEDDPECAKLEELIVYQIPNDLEVDLHDSDHHQKIYDKRIREWINGVQHG